MGGVGSYVKASSETNESVGDRANDGARVDAIQLRARSLGGREPCLHSTRALNMP
jgi:glutamate dehydrogenase